MALDPAASNTTTPDSDEEYMVVEEADSTAAKLKKSGLKRIESLKNTFSLENVTKTKEHLGTKVNKLSERIVSAERREKIRLSGERLKQSGERFKETIAKNVPAKLNPKKERTVAEGQEGAEGTTEVVAPIPPPKGRKVSPDVAYTKPLQVEADKSKLDETEVPVFDMKQLS